jgi:hypothetical protein
MRRIDRKGLRAPARVLDLELASVDQVDEDAVAVEQYNTVWCLPRIDGVPQEISFWDVTEDASVSVRDLRDQLCAGWTADNRMSPGPPPPRTGSLDATVVICTRDRPVGLRATLASLRRQTDSDFGVLVVDNGSSSPESARVVEDLGLARCEYVVEPGPGLARARNRALGAVHTDFVAWIDDDEVADPNWVRRLKESFAHEAKPAAVCGVMLPAELEFEAQVRFETVRGFNKGRGMAPEVYFRRLGVGRLEYLHQDLNQAVEQRLGGGFHQIGTTRMSASPSGGVVDQNLAVHGVPNVYVASSPAFVTSGAGKLDLHGCSFCVAPRRSSSWTSAVDLDRAFHPPNLPLGQMARSGHHACADA